MANKRNAAMWNARQAHTDILRHARVLGRPGLMVLVNGDFWRWSDNNGYDVEIHDGKITSAVKRDEPSKPS